MDNCVHTKSPKSNAWTSERSYVLLQFLMGWRDYHPGSLKRFLNEVFVGDEKVILAPIQFTILKILMENYGRVVSRDSLLIRVWGYDFEGNDRVVDNHIKKLRKSLGYASNQIKFEDVSLGEVCDKIFNRYNQVCKEKNIIASLEGNAVIKADHSLIERVIDNFFVNAIDSTPNGGIIRR